MMARNHLPPGIAWSRLLRTPWDHWTRLRTGCRTRAVATLTLGMLSSLSIASYDTDEYHHCNITAALAALTNLTRVSTCCVSFRYSFTFLSLSYVYFHIFMFHFVVQTVFL